MKKSMLYLLICVLSFCSCNVAEPIFISNDNLKFKSVNDSILQFSIDSYIYNPTKLKYQLKELFFDINYDGGKIGNGKLIAPIQIKPKDTIALPFSCNLSLAQLQKKHKQILSKDRVDFYFVGEAFAVHPIKSIRKGFELKIPYQAKSFISNNMLSSDLVFKHIEIEKINPFSNSNPTKSNFRIKIGIHNSQSFDYKIRKIEISLKSKSTNRVVLEGVLDTIVDAPSLQTIKIPLDIESNNLNILQNLGTFFLSSDSSKYIGAGSVTISIEGYDFQIPFLQEFDIETNPFGSIRVNPNIDGPDYCSAYQKIHSHL
ncbi:hypothetical protein DKG77_07390 [Flagellimonas aquimarina]|uniref:Late embryogenesis abundant protein LEA-2 subgroup domain-containing protein n=1 Tax=Flagellimonas aquimarina TaxID=2201895 RepID=A0A316KYC9_9FLAO|nr:hypothetical protein [Allomuricauda koreensis]PWL38108.1 hypothetical protein DKG77_07390 [Allomuricauda koreensis]